MTNSASATQKLRSLHAIADDARDDDWYVEFLDTIPVAQYALHSKEPIKSPDGFYYYYVSLLPETGAPKDADIVSLDTALLEECLDKCIGVVIYPDLECKEDPVWILSYGELHSFYEFETFIGDPQDLEELSNDENDEDVGDDVVFEYSTAEDSFIHEGARRFLKNFFDALGLEGVQVAVAENATQVPSRALALSVSEDDFQSEEELDAALETISWLLPPNRAVMLTDADDDAFEPLV